MKNVYLDNNATTAVAPEVIAAMKPFFEEFWGNPSSMHTFGGRVKKHIENARGRVAALIGASPDEIVFTSCGTESDNAAVRGAAEVVSAATPIVTTRVEHAAVLASCRHLRNSGHEVIEIGVDSAGNIRMAELRKALAGAPAVVSIMWANNETGVLFPMKEIAEVVQDSGSLLHTDAVQAVGKVPVNVQEAAVDMLSLSGHKLHAPKGVGALYVRKGTSVAPFMLGGHQEGGKRAGTENVPYIVGLGKACELAREHLAELGSRVADLRDKLQDGIMKACPNTSINGDVSNRVPNTVNLGFDYIEGEAILLRLNDLGIAASSGSACTSGSLEPSHVIRAMGVPFTAAHGSIRFSLSRYTTEEEINYVIAGMPGIVKDLREMSPFGR
jgi:cysteine desulfurase